MSEGDSTDDEDPQDGLTFSTILLRDMDVICGHPTAQSERHRGNQMLRRFVDHSRNEYRDLPRAPRIHRRGVVNRIYLQISRAGGRFLKPPDFSRNPAMRGLVGPSSCRCCTFDGANNTPPFLPERPARAGTDNLTISSMRTRGAAETERRSETEAHNVLPAERLQEEGAGVGADNTTFASEGARPAAAEQEHRPEPDNSSLPQWQQGGARATTEPAAALEPQNALRGEVLQGGPRVRGRLPAHFQYWTVAEAREGREKIRKMLCRNA